MTPIFSRGAGARAKSILGRPTPWLELALVFFAIVLAAWIWRYEPVRAALIDAAQAPASGQHGGAVALASWSPNPGGRIDWVSTDRANIQATAADPSPIGSQAFLLAIVLAAAAFGFSVAPLWLYGRWFTKPMKELQTRAEQLAAGTAVDPRSTGVAEFDTLNASLVEAAKVLRGREDRQRRAESELRNSEEHFRLLADSVPQLVWTARPDGRIDYANARRENYGSGGVSRTDWEDIIHPDDRRSTAEAWLRASEAPAPYEKEHRLMVTGKGYRWHLSRAAPLLDPFGVVIRWYGTTTDINDHKLREDRIRSLIAEVNHRSRNLLAVAQSIARQTVKDGESAQGFEQRYSGRLLALVASQNLLTEHQWSGVALEALLASLTNGQESSAARVVIVGAPILLNPSAVQTLSLATHELFSNALRYGALSNDRGVVEVTWRVDEGDFEAKFEMEWRERGGPPIPDNPKLGFGAVLMVKMVAQGLDGGVDLQFEPDGLVWRLSAPLNSIVVTEEQRLPAALSDRSLGRRRQSERPDRRL